MCFTIAQHSARRCFSTRSAYLCANGRVSRKEQNLLMYELTVDTDCNKITLEADQWHSQESTKSVSLDFVDTHAK